MGQHSLKRTIRDTGLKGGQNNFLCLFFMKIPSLQSFLLILHADTCSTGREVKVLCMLQHRRSALQREGEEARVISQP